MTKQDEQMRALDWACKGDPDAVRFLMAWQEYVHRVDDIIDKDRCSAEDVLTAFALAIRLYSDPFYLRNIAALRQIALNCTSAYADSVEWESSVIPWQREWADHYRHFGNEMVVAVATIVGGYEHARKVSPFLRVVCYTEHHGRDGKSV
jgi:hypothetical protein